MWPLVAAWGAGVWLSPAGRLCGLFPGGAVVLRVAVRLFPRVFLRFVVCYCGVFNERVEVAFCCIVCVNGVVVVRVYECGSAETLRVAAEPRVLDGAEFVCVEEVEASP